MRTAGRSLIVLAAVAAGASCDGSQSMFDPQGPAAGRIAWLGWLLIAVSLGIYAAVMLALARAMMRRPADDDLSPRTTSLLTRRVTLASAATVVVHDSTPPARNMTPSAVSSAGAIRVRIRSADWPMGAAW